MLTLRIAFLGVLAACGSVSNLPDGGPQGDGADSPDGGGTPDACMNRVLFDGGLPYAQQGWVLQQSGTVSVVDDPALQATSIQTQTSPTGLGSFALLSLPGAVPAGPFTLDWEVMVLSVTTHNQFDAAVALLGSYGGGFGLPIDREQMFYIDRDRIGWGDDTQSLPMNAIDNMFHTYRFSVDAQRVATVRRDVGSAPIGRMSFTTDGNLAMGDQTNDANVEASMSIRRLTLVQCP